MWMFMKKIYIRRKGEKVETVKHWKGEEEKRNKEAYRKGGGG